MNSEMDRLSALRKKETKLVVGLMSGTSRDGVDAALLRVRGHGTDTTFELLAFETYPYPEKILRHGGWTQDSTVEDLTELNFLVGDCFALAAQLIAASGNVDLSQIDLIGSHGQTVCHLPPRGERTRCSTLQIGEPDVIAERTGAVVVADFRTRDVAAGGEGAPLVPYFDWLFLRKTGSVRVALNIGGIANLTVVTEELENVFAFDTGPGNLLINNVMRLLTNGKESLDRDGEMATSGQVDKEMLRELLRHPYFSKSPPKTTGAEEFGPLMAQGLVSSWQGKREDLVATVTALTVRSIADAVRNFVLPNHRVAEIVVSGGGAHNHSIMWQLQMELSPIKIIASDEIGIPIDAKEAIAFAILANERIHDHPTNVPGATGAKRRVCLGKLCFP